MGSSNNTAIACNRTEKQKQRNKNRETKPAMMRRLLVPVLCSVLIAADPQTRQFHNSYYITMMEGLIDQPGHHSQPGVGGYGGDSVGGAELEQKEYSDETSEEAFSLDNNVYAEYHEPLADGVEYKYEEYKDEDYHNNEHEGDKLNNILYEEEKLEGREAPEDNNVEKSSEVDIREFTLMISKLLFRL